MSEACLLHSDQFFLVLFQRTDLLDKCLHLVVFLKMEISKRIKVMVYRYDFFSDFGFPQDLRSKRVGFHSSPDLSLPCLPLVYFFSSLFSGKSFYQLGAEHWRQTHPLLLLSTEIFFPLVLTSMPFFSVVYKCWELSLILQNHQANCEYHSTAPHSVMSHWNKPWLEYPYYRNW